MPTWSLDEGVSVNNRQKQGYRLFLKKVIFLSSNLPLEIQVVWQKPFSKSTQSRWRSFSPTILLRHFATGLCLCLWVVLKYFVNFTFKNFFKLHDQVSIFILRRNVSFQDYYTRKVKKEAFEAFYIFYLELN